MYTWLQEKYLHYISFIKRKLKANLLNCILILYFQIGKCISLKETVQWRHCECIIL